MVNGQSSLAGVNIGDVVGWAPTDDVLATSKNLCTGESFSGFTLVGNDPESGRENDQALAQLLNGEVDALWICKCQILSVAMLSISFFLMFLSSSLLVLHSVLLFLTILRVCDFSIGLSMPHHLYSLRHAHYLRC